MNPKALQNLPHKLAAAFVLAVSAVVLGSCGGGGAATDPSAGGPVRILPDPGTFYAGIPYTLTFTGGRRPYNLSSSDQTILAVPDTFNGSSLTVVANNPGVVDPGLQPNEVPRRTVTIGMRDVNGSFYDASIAVLQNFLTGYNTSFISGCPTPPVGDPPVGCAGGSSFVTVTAVTNGSLYGNRVFRFEVVRGDFRFYVPESPSNPPGTFSNTCTTNTDHQGIAICRFIVATNAPSQLATVRTIDVATGVYVDTIFAISGAVVPTGPLTALPDQITFTSSRTGACGTGSADFLVFDGTPPYSATSTSGFVSVNPASSPTEPGRFTVTAGSQGFCGTANIVVTDSTGRRVTLVVTTTAGPAAQALTVAPSTLNLATCGASGSAIINGGTGTFSALSGTPAAIGTSVAGNTVTVTRLNGQGGVLNLTATPFQVTITDGNTNTLLTVNAPTNCP